VIFGAGAKAPSSGGMRTSPQKGQRERLAAIGCEQDGQFTARPATGPDDDANAAKKDTPDPLVESC
jgi:hypothetical protein